MASSSGTEIVEFLVVGREESIDKTTGAEARRSASLTCSFNDAHAELRRAPATGILSFVIVLGEVTGDRSSRDFGVPLTS